MPAEPIADSWSAALPAAMVFEGDFVAGIISGATRAVLGVDADVFPFPSVGPPGATVVAGGDAAVLMRRSAAGDALIRYLASPEGAAIWAAQGGFTNGQSQTLWITTSTGTITAADFDYQSTLRSGGDQVQYAAVHVQNTPSGGAGSAWVGATPGGSIIQQSVTPEPSSMAIAALGALGFLGYGLRRRFNK